MKIRCIVFLLLAFSHILNAPAQEKKSFWDRGFGKFLKSVDNTVDSWQESGDIFGKDVVDIFDIKESEELALTSKDSANARSRTEADGSDERKEHESKEPLENIDTKAVEEKEEDHAGNS